MKRKIPVLIALALVLVLAVMTACASAIAPQGQIPEDKAKTIALEDAGLIPSQVSRLRAQYEIDDGVPQYDVEFYHNGYEYSYEIHADTGKILSFEKDR